MLKTHCDQSARSSDPGAFSLPAAIIEAERSRTCIKCGFSGSESLFKKSGKHSRSNTCKRCDAARVRKWAKQNRETLNATRRRKYRENIEKSRRRGRERARTARGLEINRAAVARYRASHPERAFARNKVSAALKSGALVKPKTCQVKGCKNGSHLHGHHSDYTKPLKVDWLCRDHHEQVHHETKRLRLKNCCERKFTRSPTDNRSSTAQAA